MSAWPLRGLRDGVVTTAWPRRPDPYAQAWRGPAGVVADLVADPGAPPDAALERLCPTGAITTTAITTGASTTEAVSTGAVAIDGQIRIDQGKCVLCGRCVDARPDLFAWSRGATGPGAAALARQALVVPALAETGQAIDQIRSALAARTTALRRSVHVRHVDAGSDGSVEWEIQALLGPVYDVHRLGVFFTASPRHADVLLVSGAGAPGMAGPLRVTYDGMPDPRVVIAVGADAISGGLLGGGLAGGRLAGVTGHVPVDIWVPGDPPSPFGILTGLLAAMGRLW